jgi:glycosyltransferase involved in cell wall biosynthesis
LKKTNFLIDCHIFDQNFQGIRTFLKGIIEELIVLKRHQLILVAHNTTTLQNEFGVHDNVTYVQLRSTNKFKRLVIELPRIINKYGAKFALFNYTAPFFKVRGCKYLTVLHDVLFLDYPEYFPRKYRIVHKLLFKLSIRSSEHILTVSDYSRKRINFHFGLKLSSRNVIPNAVDKIFYNDVDKSISKNKVNSKFALNDYILFVSRIESRKNHQLIIDWYTDNRIYDKNIQLVFVGKFAFNEVETKNNFEQLKTKTNKLFLHLEQVNNQDLFDLNNAAKVVIFPSLCEGFGIPPLESALLKTPTLSSNLCAMEDFDFFKEYHQDPKSPEFIDKLNELVLTNKRVDESFLDDCAEAINKKYNWKTSANYLAKIID